MRKAYVLLALFLIICLYSCYRGLTEVYSDPETSRRNIVALINLERLKNNNSLLKTSNKLNRSACMKLDDLVANQYFGHYSPTGVSFSHWVKLSGYDYKTTGENLARGYKDSVSLVKAWMNSSSHRMNILARDYTEIGLCVKRVNYMGAETTLVVSHFGS